MHILWLVRTTLPQAGGCLRGWAGASDVSGQLADRQLARCAPAPI